MTKARTGNYVWVTWLSKLMAGETQCHWGVWFKTHFQDFTKAPSDFQQATWLVEHNKCLNGLCDEFQPEATALYKEKQNKYIIKRKSMTIAGQPDLVVLGKDGNYTVYDIKTGQAKPSDVVQVMLYMACLPYTGSGLYKNKKLAGCVVYKDDRTLVPPEAINDTFNKQVGHFLDILDSSTRPAKVPSYAECHFCEITKADCCERIETEESPTESTEWPV